ncbi:MAG: hypothetical protein KDK70_24400 [Myxococcales bacterium]|nr:hypothetical protein [Myxococcales bacterium]
MRGTRWALVAWGMALVLGGVGAACDGAPAPAVRAPVVEAAGAERERASADVEAAADAEVGASTLEGPPTELVPLPPGQERMVGTVLEHLATGSYHYLRIAPEQGAPRWVVTMGGEFREGARVEVTGFGAREGFYSRRLDRRFDELTFGMVAELG